VVPGASGGNTFGIPTAFGSQNAPPPNMQSYTSQVIFDLSLAHTYYIFWYRSLYYIYKY